MPASLKDRLLSKRSIDPIKGCWFFLGKITTTGYGEMSYHSKLYGVHRLSAYIWLGLDLNSKDQVNHKCSNRHCFNYEHIYIGNQSQNMLDYHDITKEIACVNGHILADVGIYKYRDKNGKEWRWCQKCRSKK